MFDSILSHFTAARGTIGVSSDRRGPDPREAVAWAAELELDGRRVPIEIGNISTSGLMASADAVVLGSGAELAVWLDGRRVTGHVRWAANGQFGLRFDAPIALDRSIIERYRPANVEATKQMSRWMV
jgi:hypothetical protein